MAAQMVRLERALEKVRQELELTQKELASWKSRALAAEAFLAAPSPLPGRSSERAGGERP